jgi:hypothetical protein
MKWHKIQNRSQKNYFSCIVFKISYKPNIVQTNYCTDKITTTLFSTSEQILTPVVALPYVSNRTKDNRKN